MAAPTRAPARPRPGLVRSLIVASALVVLVAACGGSDGGGGGGARPADETVCTDHQALDPSDFVDPRSNTNEFHPTKPGIQWVRGGTTEVGTRAVPYENITTMTDVIREIDGIPTVAMLDENTDSGEVSQVGIDYLALDKLGNVWLLGGYTEDFEGGEFTNTEDHWLGTGGGEAVGILAPKDVTKATRTWCIGGAPDEDPAVGIPKQVDIRECVEFGCYENVRVVTEGEFDAPDNEDKYYAPGVGVIRNVPLDASLHQDTFELRNLVELSPEGLAAASQTVLDLEAHAREVAPEVYGSSPVSRRAAS